MTESYSHPIPERYARIDQANEHSFYVTDADRPFDVIMSVHSIGPPRSAARFILAGNMSTVTLPDGTVPYGPSQLTDAKRLDDSRNNMKRHFENIGVDPSRVRVLNPERTYHNSALSVVNVDEDSGVYDSLEPVRLKQRGDFIYSSDPDVVLAVRPADCPVAIMSAQTPTGRTNMMVHFAWRGVAYGQFSDIEKEFDTLGIDRSTLRVYITAGGQAESYRVINFVPDNTKQNPVPVEGNLCVDVKEHVDEDGVTRYDFGIDTPHAVYRAFLDLGLDARQIFLDTSSTTSLSTGYGSHSRATRRHEDNVRDIVTAQFRG